MHKKAIGKYREKIWGLSRALGEVRKGSLDLESGKGLKSAFFVCTTKIFSIYLPLEYKV
jgi:hypothetical protein